MKTSNYTLKELLLMVQEEVQRSRNDRITGADDVYRVLHEYASKDQEYFLLLTLDGASKIIEKRVIHIGTLNQSLVHPREIFKPAITDGAAGIIIAHYHP
jgi:DNA repair protein RadC